MSALSRPVIIAVVLLALPACGSSQPGSESPTPTAAPSATSPSSIEFESARHGYRLEVPPDWQLNEYEGTWTDLEQFSPGAEVPGEDVVATADRSSFLVMNSMAVPDGMAPDEWWSAFDAIVASERDATCPATTGAGVLAGQPATVVEETCNGAVIRGHSLVHAGRGYYFTTRGPEDDPEVLAVIEDITASIEFTG